MAFTKESGVIILGHPRSGTTLLRRILNGHENLHCPGETHVLNSCARFIQAEKTAHGLDMGILSGMHFAGISEEEIINQVRNLGFSLLEQASTKKLGKRWVEKTAVDSNYIDEIDQLFGEHAYFIGIVRHGLDVAISSKDFSDATGMYLNMFKPYINQYQQPLEALLRSWVDVTTDLLNFSQKHPENCLLIRYEDLIDEPEEVLSHILEFIGEDFSPEIISEGLENTSELGLSDHKCLQQSKVTKVNSKRWELLSDFQLNHLSKIANPLLEMLGYDKIETLNSVSKEDALRNYELGLMVNANKIN